MMIQHNVSVGYLLTLKFGIFKSLSSKDSFAMLKTVSQSKKTVGHDTKPLGTRYIEYEVASINYSRRKSCSS